MIRSYNDHAANERTFLAWVRTGLSTVALGIVVEKGSILSLVISGASTPMLTENGRNHFGNYGGSALIALGVAVILSGGIRFIRNALRIDDQITYSADVVRLASALRRRCRPKDGAIEGPHPVAPTDPSCNTKRATSGGNIMKRLPIAVAVVCVCSLFTTSADARTSYDGPWSIAFVTKSGPCDPTYGFPVYISNGVITQPNLVRFRGYVTRSGIVHASVTVHEKYAAGSGRLAGASGHGTWSGHSGNARCTGYWTAQRN